MALLSDVRNWTTADLAAIYTTHSRLLNARAYRYVHDWQIAEDIVQEAFIKLLLASPELRNREHLLAYVQKTVTNLAINSRRDQGKRPLLVAVDSEGARFDVDAVSVATNADVLDELVRADDAAIVREAIARLSDSDRMIILAADVAEQSISQIASEYGMKEASVHNALYRARRNLRQVLESWVIDEVSGMTAAEFLSRTYRKVSANSKKVTGAALSLFLVAAALVGFGDNSSRRLETPKPRAIAVAPRVEIPKTTVKTDVGSKTSTAGVADTVPPLQTWALDYLSKVGPLGWPGLDASGRPVGFTVNDGAGLNGLALISHDPFVIDTKRGMVTADSRFTTFQDGLNVIISQRVTNTFGRVSYYASPIVRVGGSWISLEIASVSTDIKVLDDGTYLITSWMIVDLERTEKNAPIAGFGIGTDLGHIPAVIATRLLTTSIGHPVIGQAVQVLDPLSSAA